MKTFSKREAKTFGDWAYLAIAKHYHKILKHESAVLKDKDPEELHQMRVGMRRLRSALVGFAPALDFPKAAGERRIGKVARELGRLRDIDVLGEALKTQYRPTLPKAEQQALDRALKTLAKQRKAALKRVGAVLNGDLYKKIKSALADWLARPSYQAIAQLSIYEILPDLLLPQVSHLLLHPGWLVGSEIANEEIQFSDGLPQKQVERLLDRQGESLHELRKEAKRSRYQMELFTQFYGDSYQGYVKDIKAIQTVLGEIQDSFVLGAFLVDIVDAPLSNQMPALAAKLAETRYQRWQEWEGLQRKFLAPQTRRDLQLNILNESAAVPIGCGSGMGKDRAWGIGVRCPDSPET